jgi:hypothetical protein
MTKLTAKDRNALPALAFAFPVLRKLPIKDVAHTRSAITRFNQVKGVSAEERNNGWLRILNAAKKFGVDVHDTSWREIG